MIVEGLLGEKLLNIGWLIPAKSKENHLFIAKFIHHSIKTFNFGYARFTGFEPKVDYHYFLFEVFRVHTITLQIVCLNLGGWTSHKSM